MSSEFNTTFNSLPFQMHCNLKWRLCILPVKNTNTTPPPSSQTTLVISFLLPQNPMHKKKQASVSQEAKWVLMLTSSATVCHSGSPGFDSGSPRAQRCTLSYSLAGIPDWASSSLGGGRKSRWARLLLALKEKGLLEIQGLWKFAPTDLSELISKINKPKEIALIRNVFSLNVYYYYDDCCCCCSCC